MVLTFNYLEIFNLNVKFKNSFKFIWSSEIILDRIKLASPKVMKISFTSAINKLFMCKKSKLPPQKILSISEQRPPENKNIKDICSIELICFLWSLNLYIQNINNKIKKLKIVKIINGAFILNLDATKEPLSLM